MNRFDTTVLPEEYEIKQARSLASLVSCATTKSFGVLHQPLINIELDQVCRSKYYLQFITDVGRN